MDVDVIASLACLNVLSHSAIHFHSVLGRRSMLRGCRGVERLQILHNSQKHSSFDTLHGCGAFTTAAIFSGRV